MRYVMNGIDKVRDGYAAIVTRLVRVALVSVAVLVAVVIGAGALLLKTPQSFLPDEDQGAFFIAMRLPEGASVNRTQAVVEEVEEMVRPIPGVEGVLSIVGFGFIDGIAASKPGFLRHPPETLRSTRRIRSRGPAPSSRA